MVNQLMLIITLAQSCGNTSVVVLHTMVLRKLTFDHKHEWMARKNLAERFALCIRNTDRPWFQITLSLSLASGILRSGLQNNAFVTCLTSSTHPYRLNIGEIDGGYSYYHQLSDGY